MRFSNRRGSSRLLIAIGRPNARVRRMAIALHALHCRRDSMQRDPLVDSAIRIDFDRFRPCSIEVDHAEVYVLKLAMAELKTEHLAESGSGANRIQTDAVRGTCRSKALRLVWQ